MLDLLTHPAAWAAFATLTALELVLGIDKLPASYRVNLDTGEIAITKVPSTPKEPFQAVLNGVKELIDRGVPAGDGTASTERHLIHRV